MRLPVLSLGGSFSPNSPPPPSGDAELVTAASHRQRPCSCWARGHTHGLTCFPAQAPLWLLWPRGLCSTRLSFQPVLHLALFSQHPLSSNTLFSCPIPSLHLGVPAGSPSLCTTQAELLLCRLPLPVSAVWAPWSPGPVTDSPESLWPQGLLPAPCCPSPPCLEAVSLPWLWALLCPLRASLALVSSWRLSVSCLHACHLPPRPGP